MRPTIAIGDIHGLSAWKNIVEETPHVRYVFLGDYTDPYHPMRDRDIIDNLQDILNFKLTNPEDVILLFGNHDLHYFTEDIYISSRFNIRIASQLGKIFVENAHLFQFAFQDGNYLFTHAGVSQEWFYNDFKGDISRNIAMQINNPTPEQVHSLCRCGEARGGHSGDYGGIFWADISELDNPLPPYIQIVGHNQVTDIVERENNGGKIIFCDCLSRGKYLFIEEDDSSN
jgi:hypothetical protein